MRTGLNDIVYVLTVISTFCFVFSVEAAEKVSVNVPGMKIDIDGTNVNIEGEGSSANMGTIVVDGARVDVPGNLGDSSVDSVEKPGSSSGSIVITEDNQTMSLSVDGHDLKIVASKCNITVDGNLKTLDIVGDGNMVTVNGGVDSFSAAGDGNEVSMSNLFSSLNLTGDNNRIYYPAGSEIEIINVGANNITGK